VNVNQDMRVVREEIFGPVLVAQRFDDLDDVVKAANDTPYGLAAQHLDQQSERRASADSAHQGGYRVGELPQPGGSQYALGGYKQSGSGREHGRVAVEMYTATKSVLHHDLGACLSISREPRWQERISVRCGWAGAAPSGWLRASWR